jgi:hypothetical protein
MGRGACQGLGRRDIAATGGLLPTAGRPSPTDRRRGDDPGCESTASRRGYSVRPACGCCRLWGVRGRGFVDDPVADRRERDGTRTKKPGAANTGISPHRRMYWPHPDQREGRGHWPGIALPPRARTNEPGLGMSPNRAKPYPPFRRRASGLDAVFSWSIESVRGTGGGPERNVLAPRSPKGVAERRWVVPVFRKVGCISQLRE